MRKDIKIPYWKIYFGEAELKKIKESMYDRNISQGPVSEELEKKLAKALDVPYVVTTTSGSVALLMSMMALDIGPGDEVIVPNRTWISTAHAPQILGAKVILVDVLKEVPLIDTSQIEKQINSKTKAIIPVHLNGRSADMNEINKIAKEHDLYVIEDACQALSSKNEKGFLGTQSDLGCFSLGITKLVSTGQGGFVVTKNKDLYEKLKLIRNNGTSSVFIPSYKLLGFNFKFNDILASIGLVQFSKLEQKINHVREVYNRYVEGTKSLSYLKIIPVDISKGEVPIYVEALSENRSELIKFLESNNIEIRPILPNVNSASYLNDKRSFPNSDYFNKHGFFLPCGPDQPLENIDYVIKILKDFKKRKEKKL